MTTAQKVKSVLYFCLWIYIVVVIDFYTAYIGNFFWLIGIPMLTGLFIGLISGIPQRRVFLVGFPGYFLTAILYRFYGFGALFMVINRSIFLGTMAMAGAVIRRVLLRDYEELYIPAWEWGILLGGCSAYADYVIYLAVIYVSIYRIYIAYIQFFIAVLIVSIGIFALGLYAGAFFNKEYENSLKTILKFSLGGHAGFALYTILLFFMGFARWDTYVFYFFIALFFVVLLAGVKIGGRIIP